MYRVCANLLDCVSCVLGASCRARYFVFSCSAAFLLSQIYANGLTSIVTVVLPERGYKTLKELFHHGYKIYINLDLFSESFEQTYEYEIN